MKKFSFGVVAVSALAITSSAFAADLPRRTAPAATPYLSPVPAFNWTGAYVGVNGGFDYASFTKGGKAAFGSPSGGLVGGTIGYNYQINQNFVAGLEGDLDWTSLSGTRANAFSANSSSRSRLNSLFTLRGRVGYAADRALIYATGGYAGGNVKSTLVDVTNGVTGSDSSYRSGYALGAGLEYAFTSNISAKAEYLYTALGTKAMFPAPDRINPGVNVSAIRAGLNYRF